MLFGCLPIIITDRLSECLSVDVVLGVRQLFPVDVQLLPFVGRDGLRGYQCRPLVEEIGNLFQKCEVGLPLKDLLNELGNLVKVG